MNVRVPFMSLALADVVVSAVEEWCLRTLDVAQSHALCDHGVRTTIERRVADRATRAPWSDIRNAGAGDEQHVLQDCVDGNVQLESGRERAPLPRGFAERS